MRVILVTDDPDERWLIETLLGGINPAYSVATIRDAAALLAEVDGHRADFAIVSARNGWSTPAGILDFIRSRNAHCQTILMARLAPEAIAVALNSASVDDVINPDQAGLRRLGEFIRKSGDPVPDTRSHNTPPANTSPAHVATATPMPQAAGGPPTQEPDSRVAELIHDIRDPLQLIQHSVRALDAVEEDTENGQGRAVRRIVSSVERMQAILDGLSPRSMNPVMKKLGPVNLEDIVDATVSDIDEQLQQVNGEISRDPLPTLIGDAVQIRRLFENIIGNALKFRSDKPPRIWVRSMDQNDRWLITVTDNGIGLEPDDAEEAFEMYTRLPNVGARPGSGIGLAVCRKIAREHGGDVWLQSMPGGGAMVLINLPKPKHPE